MPHTGQAVIWTATEGPGPCASHLTCICVLPTTPPVISTCPDDWDCSGQVVTWPSDVAGPTLCEIVCTVDLPTTAEAQVTTESLIATESATAPIASSTPEGPQLLNSERRESEDLNPIVALLAAGAAINLVVEEIVDVV